MEKKLETTKEEENNLHFASINFRSIAKVAWTITRFQGSFECKKKFAYFSIFNNKVKR